MKIDKTVCVTFRALLNPLIYCIIVSFAAACAQTGAGGDTAGWVDEPAATGQTVPSDSTSGTSDGSDESIDDTSTNETSAGDESEDEVEGGSTDAAPPPCAEIEAEAANLLLPVDIIWAIDSSGSMRDEIDLVQERMNGFVEFMETTGIDYRLVLLAGEHEDSGIQSFNVCIPPPLSSVNSCPDADGPRYRHVETHVDSTNAYEQLIVSYDQYSDFLRPNAAVHMVVVSDDQSHWEWTEFLDNLTALGHAPFVDNFTFHSVVSEVEEDCFLGFCWDAGCSGPYGSASAPGTEYLSLSEATGGVTSNICSAEWDPIFTSMTDSVLETTRIPCAFAMPETPDGLVVDYEAVTISFEDENGHSIELSRVSDETACGGSNWYYDDLANPTYIQICPESCGAIFGNLEITFGCEKG